MTEFDLINWENKKYVTREGRPARIVCVNVKNEVFPIIAVVKDDSNEHVHSYRQDGKWQEMTSHMDLFNAIEPEKRKEVWICLYTNNTLTYHHSLKTADGQHPAVLKDRIARKKVVIKEGEWDE